MRIITSFWAIWKQQQRCWMTLPKSYQASAWASIQHQACLALFLCSDHSSTLLKWQLPSCFTCFVQTWSSDNEWKYSHPNDLVAFWARLVELKYLFNVLTCISWKWIFFPSLRFSSSAGWELQYRVWAGSSMSLSSSHQYKEVNAPWYKGISILVCNWHKENNWVMVRSTWDIAFKNREAKSKGASPDPPALSPATIPTVPCKPFKQSVSQVALGRF